MPKIFTTVPGLVVNVGGYGDASNDVPAVVPEEVADQIEREISGISHYEEVDGKKTAVKFAKKETRLRVERDVPERKAAAGKLSGHDLVAAGPVAKAEK